MSYLVWLLVDQMQSLEVQEFVCLFMFCLFVCFLLLSHHSNLQLLFLWSQMLPIIIHYPYLVLACLQQSGSTQDILASHSFWTGRMSCLAAVLIQVNRSLSKALCQGQFSIKNGGLHNTFLHWMQATTNLVLQ